MDDNIFSHALHVAPHIKYWNGGIISVVTQYRDNIENFQYHPSTGPRNKLLNVISYPYILLHFIFTLAFNRKIKIVHIHGATHGSFLRKYIVFLIAKYLFRKKTIYHTHGAEFHLFYENAAAWLKKIIRHFVRRVDCVVVLSASWKKYFADTFGITHLTIVPNIVARVPPRQKKNIATNQPLVFLFLGAIGNRKGVFDLLQTIATHRSQLEGKCIFKIGGDGEVDRLTSEIQKSNLQELVHFLGFVSGEKKQALLNSSDVFILPSYNEGLPISILEALAHSMPVISTTVGGIPEIVHDGKNGILIPPGDPDVLYKAIQQFVEQPNLINIYGQKSYEIASHKYFPEFVVDSLKKVYQQMLYE